MNMSNGTESTDHSVALQALGWKPLRTKRKKTKAKFMYKLLNKMGPKSLTNLFTHKGEVANYKLKLHPDKCKELRISFSKDQVVLDQIILNGKEVEIVESAKLLGVTISNNLSWHAHIKEVVKKASKRL
jgi:hypothetical protein